MDIESILIIAACIIGLFIFIGLIMARLYRRSTREVSLVKTGSGGRKVIMDGGTIVVPLLHEVGRQGGEIQGLARHLVLLLLDVLGWGFLVGFQVHGQLGELLGLG